MKIYKYFSQNRIQQVLIDSMLRFTQPSELNDPFEIRPYIEGLIDPKMIEKIITEEELNRLFYEVVQSTPEVSGVLSNIKLTSEQSQDVHKIAKITLDRISSALNKKFYEMSDKNFGILSLTSKYQNLLMWAHYGNSHQGFVVEFDGEHLFFNQNYNKNNFLGTLQKIDYSEKRPQNYLHDFNIQQMYLTKSNDWAYEDEYRMFLPLEDATEIRKEIIYLFKIPVDIISAIYCGSNINQDNLNIILQLVKDKRELSHIQVHQAKLSEKFYALEFNRLR